MGKISREDLVSLVQFIMDASGSEEDMDAALAEASRSVPHPRLSDLIYYPAECPDNPSKADLSAEQIVDIALAYKPVITPRPRDD